MGLKRILNCVCVLIFVFCFTLQAFAEKTNVISLGKIGVKMPEISIEIKGSGYSKDEISAALESEKLTVENVFEYNAEVNSSCAYILVDLSTSMYGSFELVKNNIISYINGLNDNDKAVLITFGEKKVTVALTGDETREEALKTVKELKCNEDGTLFYEALSQAYRLSNGSNDSFDMEYVIAFSDGIDVQKGSSTFDEVIEMYDSHALPLYAACSYNTSKEAADKFGELARISGGSFSIIETDTEFNDFLDEINDVTIVKLKAESNRADGKERQLSVNVGSSQIEYNIPIMRSIPDTSAPVITDLIYDIEKDSFLISFSEKVVGAGSNAAYKITDSKNKKVEISAIFYSEIDDVYEIKTVTPITQGTYTFEFSGIKDDSNEANALSDKMVLKVEKSNNSAGLPLWSIILIVIASVSVIGIVVLISVLCANKKKKSIDTVDGASVAAKKPAENIEYVEPEQGGIKHHIKTNSSVRIRLKIKTGKTSEQNVETGVSSSLIVGRSDTCDIYIDDTKLSRQHFVIENDNGVLYVMDLQSRNGTMLNGIRINSRQRLQNGDKIMAGLSDIIITVLGW